MEETQIQFHLEEYRSLKKEIEYRIKATEKIEIIVVGGITALYGWLSQQSDIPPKIWWIPVGLTLFGLFRQIFLLNRIMEIASYIREIEAAFCTDTLHGWENFLAEIRRKIKGNLLSISGYLLWVVLLIITTLIAINGGLNDNLLSSCSSSSPRTDGVCCTHRISAALSAPTKVHNQINSANQHQ